MWDKMEVFYRVVKAGSFTNAEKVLNKSQGTLSRSVAILEERLDARLLHRKIKGLELTRKGEEVFKAAQRMFMEVDGMKTILNEENGIQGKIRISTTYALANYVLADPIIEFQRIYPEINFEIYCNDKCIDIIHNEVDVAIRPYEADKREIEQEHLFTLQSNLYASPKYLEQHGTPATIQELANHHFIAFSRPEILPYADLEWFLNSEMPTEKNRICKFRVNSVEMHFKAAEEGLGIIASYDDMSITKKSNLVKVLPDFKGPKYKEHFVYPKKIKNLQKIKTFKNFLIEQFREKRY